MSREITEQVKQRLIAYGLELAGNCYETALAVGIMLANPERIVRLVRGQVRSVPHWWILVDGKIVDPTAEQFNPLPNDNEYQFVAYERVDLESLAFLLTEPLK